MNIPTAYHHRHCHRDGFTLLEIMVVVIILGVLAVTIVPQFMGATTEAKIGAAKSHVAELEAAVERFYVQMDRYPTQDEGLLVLEKAPATDASKWRGPTSSNSGTIPGVIPTSTGALARSTLPVSTSGPRGPMEPMAERAMPPTSSTDLPQCSSRVQIAVAVGASP